MTEVRNLKCDLEVVDKNGKVQCSAICLVHFMTDACCKYCEETRSCKKVCWLIKEIRKSKKG